MDKDKQYISLSHDSHNLLPYQYFLWRFCNGWKNIYTLCREVSLLLGTDALANTPARVHHCLTILLIQDD